MLTRSMSGIQGMAGYRLALNLSYFPDSSNDSNSTATSCDSQDDVETAAILVCLIQGSPFQ